MLTQVPLYHPCWLYGSTAFTPKFLKMVCFWCSWPLHAFDRVNSKTAKRAVPQYLAQPKVKCCTNPDCKAKWQPEYAKGLKEITWPKKTEFESKEEEAFANEPFTVSCFCSSTPSKRVLSCTQQPTRKNSMWRDLHPFDDERAEAGSAQSQ